MQLAASVAAHGGQRPAFVSRGQLRAPHRAQDDVDELGARMHQGFDGLIAAKTLDQLGVCFLELRAECLGRESGFRQALGQVRKPPRRV